MFDPWERFKSLPWVSLISTAVVTLTIIKILDLGLMIAYSNVPEVQLGFDLIFSPPWGLIIIILLSIGLGALSVLLLETYFSPGLITAGTLWGLFLCLFVVMLIISFVSTLAGVSVGLLGINQNVLVGTLIGVFWRGRRYWRW